MENETKTKTKKEKGVVITRHIQIIPNYGDDKEKFIETYKTLYRWRDIVFKSANMISSHLFIQEQTKELIYFTDEVKVKLQDINKDENGILTTSKQNSTYQILSKQFKGSIPTAILTALNSNITSTFAKNKKHYFSGERSLMNYKRTIPIPIQSANLLDIKKTENKDYTFSLFGLNFKTHFGKDLSGNQLIFDRAMEGEYKLSDSSIKIDGKKIFLLAVFQFDKQIVNIDKKNVCNAKLDFETPILLDIKGKELKIGSKDEFLYRRLAIQKAFDRAKEASTFNKGGRGIHKKMAATDKLKDSEINYIKSRVHKYSAMLIHLCLKNKCGVINLINVKEVKEKTKLKKSKKIQDDSAEIPDINSVTKETDKNDDKAKFLLRNWSYFGLIEKIKYKANKYNIEVVEVDVDAPSA